MANIYDYDELHKFLRDSWKEKKKRNSAFSMTAWSKQLGLENSSPLSLAFKGKRTLPKKYLPQIIRSLDLSSEEGIYLETLADFSKAKSPEQKILYLKRLQSLSPRSEISANTVEAFKFISDPLHTSIMEMTELRGFQAEPKWIQSRLSQSVKLESIKEAIERLLLLELLQFKGGRLVKTYKDLSSPPDIEDLGTQKYHQSICEMAIDAISDQDISTREFNSYSFNMNSRQMHAAKKKIRSFIQEFLNEFEADTGTGDQTYQINLQLFKVTQ